MTELKRTTFKTSRAAQYVEARALTAMTGQAMHHFADVVTKELMDNALDACETVGVAPEVALGVTEEGFGGVTITVSDNGGGISEKTVHDALNFDVLVSDKAAYRSPTRGAQGNALKTVFGIPHALGSHKPVVVEAQGTRHEARVWKDPAGQLRVQCDDTEASAEAGEAPSGTTVSASVPTKGTGRRSAAGPHVFLDGYDPESWAKAFALFNPHATVKISRFQEGGDHGESPAQTFEDSYLPTQDPTKRFKCVPSDPTSPHWYDEEAFKRLVFSHIGHHLHEGGEDLRLRDFVRQFKGLSATAKAKVVCDAFPHIDTLSDFENKHSSSVDSLLEGMKHHSEAPSHATLGTVGKRHFEERFEEYYGELKRFDYKKTTGTLKTGMPYVVEFAIAELDDFEQGELFLAVNYSPTFGDPLADLRFRTDEIWADGIGDFLEDGFVHPEYGNFEDPDPPNTAVAFHVITPAPLFLDQGKTRLEGFTDKLEGPAIGKAIFSKIRSYHKEGKRRVKSQRIEERAEEERDSPEKPMSLKDATSSVLEEAWRHTTGNGRLPVGVRRLFYAVRSRIEHITTKRFHPLHGYKYFSQTLLPEYQQWRVDVGGRPLPGIYYDPRGKLHEAHSGRSVDLGTREVEAYEFPPYAFNKLLYVEKKGQFPLLKAARLMERYDMGIVTGEGFSTVAARTLVQTAQKDEKYQIFVLHDADYPGYNIVRTLREETARMPGYSVELYDLGLTVEQAIQAGKEPEGYVRSSSLPTGLEPLLSPVEREWFVGEHISGKSWNSKRFELDNLTAPETVRLIEDRLSELGVEPKLIPPDAVLASRGKDLYREKVRGWVDEIIAEMLDTDELKDKMASLFEERFKLRGARAWIETEFDKRDDSKSWRAAVKDTLQAAYATKHRDGLRAAVREYITETVASEAEDEDA